MIIIGDKYISCDTIKIISSVEDIKTTKPNSVVIFNFNKELMSYCMVNNIQYGIKVADIKESIYANSLNARYILPNNNQLNEIQKVAENYMFDSKIIATITNEDEINSLALKEIDGVIFKEFLI